MKPMAIFRNFVKRVRLSKKLRSVWVSKSTRGSQPPSCDTPTRWGSTYAFSAQCLKDKEVIEHVNEIAPTDGDADSLAGIEPKDWSIMKSCNLFLEKPSKVCIDCDISVVAVLNRDC